MAVFTTCSIIIKRIFCNIRLCANKMRKTYLIGENEEILCKCQKFKPKI